MPTIMTDAHQPILVVDDDADARDAIRDALEGEGFAVVTASNGREALDKLSSLTPCLILLDLLMPIMTGVQFMAAYHEPAPVVIVSAYDQMAGNVQNATGFIKKPIELDQLVDTVRRYC
jgi:CheY-like chemotaxis protein